MMDDPMQGNCRGATVGLVQLLHPVFSELVLRILPLTSSFPQGLTSVVLIVLVL